MCLAQLSHNCIIYQTLDFSRDFKFPVPSSGAPIRALGTLSPQAAKLSYNWTKFGHTTICPNFVQLYQ